MENGRSQAAGQILAFLQVKLPLKKQKKNQVLM